MEAFSLGMRRGLVVVSIAGLLAALSAGCGGGGGGGPVALFFGYGASGGDQDCERLEFDIDVEGADAVLATDTEGVVDCLASAYSDQFGCDVTFDEGDDGHLLVTVAGCGFMEFNALFQCGFDEVDLDELTNHVSVVCHCEADGCDLGPPACVGDSATLDSCELCDDDIDNDGDRQTDCADPNCEWSNKCYADTTSTTTTEEPTTTTTLPDDSCLVTFRVLGSETIGSLQWVVPYGEAPGSFAGSGGGVDCESLVDGALAAFNDVDATSTLEAGLVSLDGFQAPADVVRCRFERDGTPVLAADFTPTAIEAGRPDLSLILPDPSFEVSVDCGGATTTTSTTTSTSTSTTTTTGDTTTTTLGEVTTSLVTFRLASASTALGALQVAVDYADANGGFQGAGASVACTNRIAGALFAPNDNDAAKKLTLGFIALTAFGAPLDLVQCTFEGAVPSPDDFAIAIEDATDSDGNAASASVVAVVESAP